MEGASENAAVRQALLDNLTGRGLDPQNYLLFVIDGSKALAKAIRATFGRHAPIQRCQVHKARNIVVWLPKPLHASMRKTLRQAWELADADKAERLIVNLARRLEREAPGVSASILEGLDEILTVTRLSLPARTAPVAGLHEHQRKHERRDPAGLSQRQTLTRRLHGLALDQRRHVRSRQGLPQAQSYKQLPALRAALTALQIKHTMNSNIEDRALAA